MAIKICRAISTNIDGSIIITPEDNYETPIPIVIFPDEVGVLYYWVLEEEDVKKQEELYVSWKNNTL